MIDEPKQSQERRRDTRLEAEGAEFLVLGHLLLHRIPSYKTYTNMPGYDLVATDPERNTSARIQVKSRWSTGAGTFLIQNFNCDFVVVVLLNRGSKNGRKQVMAPQYYVLPVGVVAALPRTEGWKKVSLRHIADLERYKKAWHLISSFVAESGQRRIGIARGHFEVDDEIGDESLARLFYSDNQEQEPRSS